MTEIRIDKFKKEDERKQKMSENREKAWHPDQMEWLEIFDEHVGMHIYAKEWWRLQKTGL